MYTSVKKIAQCANVSTQTIYKWIHKQGLPHAKKGHMIRIPIDDFNKWFLGVTALNEQDYEDN